jgi:hypothetical protein
VARQVCVDDLLNGAMTAEEGARAFLAPGESRDEDGRAFELCASFTAVASERSFQTSASILLPVSSCSMPSSTCLKLPRIQRAARLHSRQRPFDGAIAFTLDGANAADAPLAP